MGPHSPLLRDVFNFVKFKSGKRSPLQGGHFKRVLKIDLLLILALSKLEFANEWGGAVLLLPVSRVNDFPELYSFNNALPAEVTCTHCAGTKT